MHRYLYNYEDFLMIDDNYGARLGGRVAAGPKRRPRRGYSNNGDEDDFDSNDDDEYDEYEFDDDDKYSEYEDRFERDSR